MSFEIVSPKFSSNSKTNIVDHKGLNKIFAQLHVKVKKEIEEKFANKETSKE